MAHWSDKQVRNFSASVLESWKGFWEHASNPVRTALVDQKVLVIISQRDQDTITTEDIDTLRESMHRCLKVGAFAATA